MELYILAGADGRTPARCHDLDEWARWLEKNEGKADVVGLDHVGSAYVSTRFFGYDMRLVPVARHGAPPLVFETMAFDAAGNALEQERSATWAEAEQLHAAVLARLRRRLAN